MKIESIYRWWKRDILSLLVANLGPWIDLKPSQSLLQMNCQFCAGKWLVGLATLKRCHRLYSLD